MIVVGQFCSQMSDKVQFVAGNDKLKLIGHQSPATNYRESLFPEMFTP